MTEQKKTRLRQLMWEAGPLTKGSMDPLFDTLFDAKAAIEGGRTMTQTTGEALLDELISDLERVISARTKDNERLREAIRTMGRHDLS